MGIVKKDRTLHPFAARIIRKKARSIAGRYGISRDERRDVEHDLVLVLLRRLDRYDPTRGSVEQFTATVIRNAVASMVEKQKAGKRGTNLKHLSLDAPVDPRDPDGPTGHDVSSKQIYMQAACEACSVELRIDLERVLSTLPPDLRELAHLLESLSVSEIARALDIPRTTVSDRVGRLRQHLREAGIDGYLEILPSHQKRFR